MLDKVRLSSHFIFTLCVATIAFRTLDAQDWRWARAYGGTEAAAAEALAGDGVGRYYLAGAFTGRFDSGDIPAVQSAGGQDVLLLATDSEGRPLWARGAGGRFNDQASALAVDPWGNVVVAGAFWLEADFSGLELSARFGSQALFVAKYSPSGEIIWARQIDGSDLQALSAIAIDPEGNIFLAGYFSRILEVDTFRLSACGQTDLFLLKLDERGRCLWATHDGLTGDTRAMCLALNAAGEPVVGGYFNDTTLIAGERYSADTFDRDVFVALYDADGRAVWARKAGGVHDDDISAVAIDANNRIWVAGYFVGVMRLNERWNIQTATGSTDGFLLCYDEGGTPLFARNLGGRSPRQIADLVVLEESIAIGGFYQGDLEIDGLRLPRSERFSGFFAAFDFEGKSLWLRDIPALKGAVFPSRMLRATSEALLTTGVFSGTASFGEQDLEARGVFNIFLAWLGWAPSAATAPRGEYAEWRIFPNPADQELSIVTEKRDYIIGIHAANGQTLGVYTAPSRIDLSPYPPGNYWLRFQRGAQVSWRKLLIVR
jgi:hypothetical protein